MLGAFRRIAPAVFGVEAPLGDIDVNRDRLDEHGALERVQLRPDREGVVDAVAVPHLGGDVGVHRARLVSLAGEHGTGAVITDRADDLAADDAHRPSMDEDHTLPGEPDVALFRREVECGGKIGNLRQ